MGYGDGLLCTGLAKNLKENHPEKDIIFINDNKDLQEIYQKCPEISKVLGSRRWKYTKFLYPVSRYLAVDHQKARRETIRSKTQERVDFYPGLHKIALLCKPFGIEHPLLTPSIRLSPGDRRIGRRVLKERGLHHRRFLCLEPNSKTSFTPNKEWFDERWQELIDRLNQYFREHMEECLIAQVGASGSRLYEHVVDLTGTTSFLGAGYFLEKCVGFVGPEGGLAHLAKAVNCRSVVLVSAWVPEETTSYDENINLYSSVDCQGCGLRVPCPRERACMADISVDQVFEAVMKLLNEPGSH